MKGKDIDEIIKRLRALYPPDSFRRSDPFRVLVSTILSQRTNDKITYPTAEKLFDVFPDAQYLAKAPLSKIEEIIHRVNYYKTKAERIKEIANIIVRDFGGKVPREPKEMCELPGVGPKTANCVLVFGFGFPAIPVDTHVHRISNRIGLVRTKEPEKTEQELKKIIPRKYWIEINELLVRHGQEICKPIKPECAKCPIAEMCDFGMNALKTRKNERD
ncbi:MAG: endonuclease III [Candidatus Thermoplasmatota archaeon]|nr:endonuclease III [Candidatus Thermoplasmatota archaeon]